MNQEKGYESMKYNRTGASGLLLPAMSFGLWHNFGENHPYKTAKEMVLTAFEAGITHFDLANNYGPPAGSAESTMGRILRQELAAHRDELILSTKAGYGMWPGPYGDGGSRKYLMSSLDQSLKRLGVDYVDIFYHHRPDPATPLEETMGALADIVRQGKALYIGLSNYGPKELEQAAEILESLGGRCLIHQHRYSMLDRKNKCLLPVVKQKKMGTIAFCPLEQGLLTDKYLHGIPKDSRAAGNSVFLGSGNITAEYLDTAGKLNELALQRGQSLAQMALAYALKDGELTSVILGASRPEQILENIKALQNPDFTEDERNRIEEILGA
ncbi:MAG: aldo/keto reductase [Acetatifactor sp.]|nr:aldo/keto reductase [Acetatifactor sp.]